MKNKDNSGDDKRPPRENNIKLTNLPSHITDDDLYYFIYDNAREPKRVFIVRDKKTKESKGYAFISFYNKEDYEIGLKNLNDKGYNYCMIKATPAN